MSPYNSRSGKKSGVVAYEIDVDSITVQFEQGWIYKYSNSSCGASAVNEMKICAKNQLGLSTYISQHQPKYAMKF